MAIERSQIYFVNLNPVQGREQYLPAGQLSEEKMQEVEAAIRYCLGL